MNWITRLVTVVAFWIAIEPANLWRAVALGVAVGLVSFEIGEAR